MECEWNINGTEKEVVEAPTYAVSHSRKINGCSEEFCSNVRKLRSIFESLWQMTPLTFSKMFVSAMSQVRLDQLLYVSYLPVSWLFSLSKIEKLWKRARTEMWQPWRPAQGSQFAAPEELNSGWCGCGADHKSCINHSFPWPQNPTPSSIRAESACCGRDKIPYSLRTRS